GGLGDVGQVADKEIVLLILRQFVALAQQVGNLILRRVSRGRRDGRDVRKLHEGDRQQFLLNRRERRYRIVILVSPLRVLTSSGHHSNDAEGQFTHADHLSNRIRAGEEIIGDGSAQDYDSRRGPDIGFSEEFSVLHQPFSDLRELLVDSLHLGV